MQRTVVIFAAFLLLGSWPAVAQNSDPFREAAPPSPPAAGRDPFQMAPEQQAVSPPLVPKPAAPKLKREAEPVVAVPQPPAPPPPPAPPSFDGVYAGSLVLVDNPNFYRACELLSKDRRVIISGNKIVRFGAAHMDGLINGDGSFNVLADIKNFRIFGKVQGNNISGKLQNSVCIYSFDLRRQ